MAIGAWCRRPLYIIAGSNCHNLTPCSPVPELSFLPAPCRGWTQAGERRCDGCEDEYNKKLWESVGLYHPSHVKNSIPYSQFLRLRRLCSEDSDFSLKSEEMCEFFDKRGYPASIVEAGHHRAQQIDRQSALQTSQKENSNRIPFTLTFHPHNHAVKSIILKTLNYSKMILIPAESFRNRH